MPRRGGKVHIATTRRHYKGIEYKTTLLRRSYREGGKVKNETLGNLSHLPDHVIDGLRAMLAGRRLVDLDSDFEIVRSRPHGHVAAVLGVLRDLGLERLICRERCRERDLVVAMICQRLLDPCSKLSTTRLVHQTTLAQELELGEVTEAELLAAMDWLYGRQEQIESALAKRHLQGEGYVLYDLSSSYLEGRCCELAAIGYSRDGKPGKPQISYGLCCAPEGQPISIEVHAGNTGDPTTLSPAVERLKDRFGIEHLVFVGDRGMITEARIKVLKEQGVGFITALRAPQIQALTLAPDFQLSLFDERGLCEVTSPQFAGERLVICRNPAVAAERARKREELLARTEQVGSAGGAHAARLCEPDWRWFPPAAASIRASGYPAHGSPTFFTAGIRLPGPGPVGSGGDDGSGDPDESHAIGRSGDPPVAVAALLLVPFG